MRYQVHCCSVFVICALSLVGLNAASAETPSAGQFSVEITNDAVFRTDKDHTSSVHFFWTPQGSPLTFRAGQDLYTPADIKSPEPPPGEHPYAAWVFLGFTYKSLLSENWLASLTLDAGSTGPRAGGEFTQNKVHKAMGRREANGWDSQIYNQWGVMTELELGYQLPYVPFNRTGAGWLLSFLGQEVGLRMQPYGRGVTGNIVQEYGAGVNLRLGHQVPAYTALPVATEGFSWHLRGNIEGKRVEKNILREGNRRTANGVSEHSYGVVLERDVLSASIGAVLHYSGLELGFDTLYESKAYNSQYYDLDGAVKFFGRDQVPGGHYMVRLTLKKVY